MALIYRPKGKALEYGELACNVYLRCSHACAYCFCPQALHIPRADFFTEPEPRIDFLRSLESEAAELARKGVRDAVFLSFIGDVYQAANDEHHMTRQAIDILNRHGLPVTILTKGGSRAIRDFSLLASHPGNSFGATLTHDDYAVSEQWEPGAARPKDRVDTLKYAHDLGISTWVSFEPVIDPEAVYRLLDATHPFVDEYKVGKLNYHPRSKEIDWVAFRTRIVERLEQLGKRYLIKRSLLDLR